MFILISHVSGISYSSDLYFLFLHFPYFSSIPLFPSVHLYNFIFLLFFAFFSFSLFLFFYYEWVFFLTLWCLVCDHHFGSLGRLPFLFFAPVLFYYRLRRSVRHFALHWDHVRELNPVVRDLRPALHRCRLQLSSGLLYVFQAELSAFHPSSRANLRETRLPSGWRQIRLVVLEGLVPSSVRNWRP